MNPTAPHSTTFRGKTSLQFLPSPFTTAPALGAQQALKHSHMSEFTHTQAGLFGFLPLNRARSREMPTAAALHRRPGKPAGRRQPAPHLVGCEAAGGAPASSGRPRGQGEEKGGLVQTGGPAHSRRRPPAVRGKKGGRRKARLQGNKVFKRRGQRSEPRAAPPPSAEAAATS